MNWLDVVIVLIIVSTVLAAYSAGLVRELVTLVALIVGIVVAGVLYDDLEKEVLVFIDNDEAALAISFLVLLGSVYLMGQLIAYTLKRGVRLLMLGPIDHIGGAFFGLVKALLIVEILLLVFVAYPGLGLDGAVDGSKLAPLFVDDGHVALVLLPGDFDDRVHAFLNS